VYTGFWWGYLPSTPGRSRRRWENNIKMDHQEVNSGGYEVDRAGSG